MNSLDAQLSFTFQQEWRRLCALFIQEITSLSLSLLSFLGLRGEGGVGVGLEWNGHWGCKEGMWIVVVFTLLV